MLDTSPLLRPQFKIITVYFFHTPKEHAVHYRPLTATYNDEIELSLLNLTAECKDLSSGALTGIAGRILQPSKVSTGSSVITGGWDSSRFGFFIEVEVTRGGRVTREAYHGFTDHLGVSNSSMGGQVVDREMRMTINDRVLLQVRRNSLSGSAVTPYKMTNQLASSTILTPQYDTVSVTESMRPSDLLAASSRSLTSVKSDYDTRTRITSQTTAANSSDLEASRYLSETFRSYRKALDSNEDLFDDEAVTLSTARGYATTPDNTSSAVLSTLHNTVGFDVDSTFSWGDLIATFPEIEDKAKFILPTNGVVEDCREQFEDMGGSNQEANVAFSLGHILPNTLFESGLGSASITIHNRGIGGGVQAVLSDATPMYKTNVDFEKRCNHLIERLETEIMMLVFDTSLCSFHIEIKTSLINNSTLMIDLDDGIRRYRVPNYCTSLSSPMMATTNVTMEGNELESLATKLRGTFETIRTN